MLEKTKTTIADKLNITDDKVEVYMIYLLSLRAAGITGMGDVVEDLVKIFKISRRQAFLIYSYWASTQQNYLKSI